MREQKSKKTLVIVESPAKAKTLKQFLGDGYEVLCSQGHVRDLPQKTLGVDVKAGFKPTFRVIPSKKAILSKLKDASGRASRIILATDPDREGEAIAWHLQELLKRKVKRAEFYEITKEKVLSAIQNAGEINERRVNSQLARRILDRLVGYGLSPVLWKKVKRGLSAGRVQSVAVRLLCEREEEIKSFTPREFWTIAGSFEASTGSFTAELVDFDGKRLGSPEDDKVKNLLVISNEDEARRIENLLRSMKYQVSLVEDKQVKRNPAPPFITATLQQEAFKRLGYRSTQTMRLAQELYEGVDIDGTREGLITYMRTDSVRVSEEFIEQTRKFILAKFGEKYLPRTIRRFRSRKGAQEAHEAIRPTNINYTPAFLEGKLRKDLLSIYTLIYNRYLASQMAESVYDQRVIEVRGEQNENNATFRASSSRLVFDGYLKVAGPEVSENGQNNASGKTTPSIPEIEVGEALKLIGLSSEQHFTKPPSRYTEASLVKELEENGIGRPSTYAPIIETIIQRGYVVREKKHLRPTEWAFVTNRLLQDYFPKVVDVDFTAEMEAELDKIEEGKVEWQSLLKSYYPPLEKKIEEAIKDGKRYQVEAAQTSESCPECGAPLVIRFGRFGRFVACSNFPKCRYVKRNKSVEIEDRLCPQCGAKLVVKTNRWGIQFIACSRYPECKYVSSAQEKCPSCGGKLVSRRAKNRSIFWICEKNLATKGADCDFVVFGSPTVESCPLCGYFLAVRRRQGKLIRFCSNKKCENSAGIDDVYELGVSSQVSHDSE